MSLPAAARAKLLFILSQVEPVDAPERSDLDAIRGLVERALDPWDRRSFDPGHLTASALVRHPTEPALALVHHRKLDLWLQPGGHAEAGEWDPAAVAAREAREEIGIEVVPARAGVLDVDVHDIPARPDEPAHQHFDLRLAFRAAADGLRGGSESHAVRWATLAELPALGCDPGLRRAAAKLLSLTPRPSAQG